jgi:HSP20 family molecular chaperone IbpA
MALVRWEPVRELSSLQEEMNRLFTHFFDAPGGNGGDARLVRRWIPAMDLVETDDHFVLRADLPGLGEDDVAIELEDNVLTVSRRAQGRARGDPRGLLPPRAHLRRVPALPDAAGWGRRGGHLGEVRQGRPRDPDPEARQAQAAPRRHPGRARYAGDRRPRDRPGRLTHFPRGREASPRPTTASIALRARGRMPRARTFGAGSFARMPGPWPAPSRSPRATPEAGLAPG